MSENAEQRRLYQGALYEDVRAAIRFVVARMRAAGGNVGKNTNERITDQFMACIQVVRLYDPHVTQAYLSDEDVRVCGCDKSCCDNHE